jgi:4-amino-4-deoxy-L-arabinose transferase-like glycosyltransferase
MRNRSGTKESILLHFPKWANLNLEREKTVFLLIFLTALLIRLSYFGMHRFCTDESLFASWAYRIYEHWDLLLSGATGVDKPPVMFYLQALSFALFGISENSARLPSVLAGLGNIYLIYRLVKKYFNSHAALMAAFLMAVSPFMIAYDDAAFLDIVMLFNGLMSLFLISEKKFA